MTDKYTFATIHSCAGKQPLPPPPLLLLPSLLSSLSSSYTHTVSNGPSTCMYSIHRKSTATTRNSIENSVQHRLYCIPTPHCALNIQSIHMDIYMDLAIRFILYTRSRRCACYPCEHKRKTNRAEVKRKQFEYSSHSMHTIVSPKIHSKNIYTTQN